jgi:sigma-B regulation protein RsbU (phosphoserine phosphatase)
MTATLDRLILQALTIQPNHGHGIAQRVTRLTRGRFGVNYGSLYPALHRLEARGALESEWKPAAVGKRAKFYRLTLAGQRQLKAQTETWNRYAEIARQLAREVAEAIHVDALGATVVDWLHQALGAGLVALFIRSDTNPGYGVSALRGGPEDARNRRFPSDGALLHERSVPFEPDTDTLPIEERTVLDAIGARLVVPLRAKDDTIGFISLGAKDSGEPYDDDDLEFLATVADQLGLGLASLRLRSQQTDLDDATAIQRRLLPTEIPQRRGVSIACSWHPAKAIGGDYYDVLELNTTLLGLCIGDVVGKGVPAALLMANLQAAVKAVATPTLLPRDLVKRVNRIITGNIGSGKFITFFYAALDAGSKTLTFTNAGHNPPLLVRADGSVETLAAGGPVLGIFDTFDYEQGQVELKTGDRLVLFTDGVTELWNREGAEFGDDGLLELLRARRRLGAPELRDAIVRAVTDFSRGDFHDDVTLVVVGIH